MNLAELFFRAYDTNTYSPYTFLGDEWTDAEKAVISAAVAPHVPEKVDAIFNEWRFSKYSIFSATRATWDHGWLSGNTAQELAAKITEYYSQ